MAASALPIQTVIYGYGNSVNTFGRQFPFFPAPTRTEKSSLPCLSSLHATTTSDPIFLNDFLVLNDLGQPLPFFPALIGCCVPKLGLMLRDELLRSKNDEIAYVLIREKP